MQSSAWPWCTGKWPKMAEGVPDSARKVTRLRHILRQNPCMHSHSNRQITARNRIPQRLQMVAINYCGLCESLGYDPGRWGG